MKNFKKEKGFTHQNFIKKISGGFTLIELLVVVAIIGLLATVVIGYLSSARKKGDETAVKSNLATTRTAIEMFFLNNGNTYLPLGDISIDGDCPSYDESGTSMFSKNKDIAGSIAEAVNRGGNGSACYNSSTGWAVVVGLKLAPNTSWCIDVTGAARLVVSSPSGAIVSGLCI
ncbi:MAG: type II secretion system protein [Candidatus Paceibacterota bacterium]